MAGLSASSLYWSSRRSHLSPTWQDDDFLQQLASCVEFDQSGQSGQSGQLDNLQRLTHIAELVEHNNCLAARNMASVVEKAILFERQFRKFDKLFGKHGQAAVEVFVEQVKQAKQAKACQ